jgi:hypothetical protein
MFCPPLQISVWRGLRGAEVPEARDAVATPTSGSSAKAAREIDEKGNHEDQTECAAAKKGAAEIKAPSAEQEKEQD